MNIEMNKRIHRLQDELQKAIETDDQYNKYGRDITSARYFTPAEYEENKNMKPVENETLETYQRRIKRYMETINEVCISRHINGPKGAWRTHEKGGPCWMCDYVTFTNIILDTWIRISQIDPKRYTFSLSKDSNKLELSIRKPSTKV